MFHLLPTAPPWELSFQHVLLGDIQDANYSTPDKYLLVFLPYGFVFSMSKKWNYYTSSLLYLEKCIWGSLILLHVSIASSISLLSKIPIYRHTTICIPTYSRTLGCSSLRLWWNNCCNYPCTDYWWEHNFSSP
jgi:hypothetical protein